MSRTWNRCASAIKAITILAAAFVAATAFAVVTPDDQDPLRQREFRHPDLWYENVFRPVAELPAGTMRTLGSELARLGVDPGHAFFDLRTGRWGTLILVEPMIPGSGVRNDLQWSSLGYEAAPQGEALEQAIWEQFRGYLIEHAAALRFDPQELAEPSVTVMDERLVYIHVGRTIDGIPVRGAFVTAAINSGNLVLVGERDWASVEVNATPTLSAAQAEDVVRGHVESFPFASLREEPHLELIPASSQPEEAATLLGAGLEYRLAWVLTPDFEGHMGSWEALVDAHSGELLSFVDTNRYASRRVEGGIFPVSNDGQGDDGTLQFGYPMPFADITLDGTDVGFTTVGGNSPAGSDAGVMATTLSGQFIRMNDVCGAVNESSAAGDLDLEGLPLPATDCEVSPGHSPGDTSSSRTGFYELNRLVEQARGYLDYPWLDLQLTANMNLNQTCNAFWNGSTVNFYQSGGGCRNTGEIAAIFDHEWGHGVDDNDANPSVSSPGESIADIIGQNRLNTSCIGRGFLIGANCGGYGDPCLDCSGVRDSDWAKRQSGLPHDIQWILDNCGGGGAPCGRETHCEGTIVAEAGWDLVHRDLQGFEGSPWNLDPNTALELGTRMSFLGSANVGNWYQCTTDGTAGCNPDSGYLGFLAADDDDGDLTNGTPHMTAIFAAFDRHQLSCNVPVVQDSGCAATPATPTNVVADTFDEGMQLTWDPVADATEYWVFRTEGVHGCDFGKALVGKTTDTTFSESGLRNGFELFYSVIAVGASDACTSVMSECVSAIPTAGPSGFIEGTVTDADTGDPIAGASVEAVGPVTVGDETGPDGTYSILAPIGTYDVTADAEDYDPQTVTGVEVTEGGTEVVDFQLTLTPVPIADISPDSFAFAVQQGDTGTDTLNIGNIGVLDLTWSIAEDDAPSPARQPAMLEEWSDDFDSYETGSQLHGQGGWKGWLNDPAAGALVSDVQAQSTPNSAEIVGASDLVHEYTDSDSGQWVYTAWQFIPTDFTGTSMFIMLNSYDDSGSGLNWSTQVEFRGAEELVFNAGASGGTLPLIRGQWVELRVEIDLVADTQDFFYNGELLYSGTWTQEVSGGGQLNIDTVDLFANGASPVYYDDMSLVDVTVAPPCTEPNDVPWLSVAPESGTTPPDSVVPVDVTVDASGLDEGDELSANLCVTTNDPDAELVQIPVSLTVLPAGGPIADVSPDSFTFMVEQGDSDDDTLNIGNLGGQELTWNIDEAESALLPVIVPEGAPYRYDLAEMPEFNAPVGGSRAKPVTRSRGEAPADRVVLPAPQDMAIGDFAEGFDDITTLPGAGWAMINNSDPEGPSSWFQGNETIFPAHEGDPDAYIAANYESTADNGTISNWLITPEVTIVNGTTITFWTRKAELFGEFADRMEVRMSVAGASTDVGDTAESVGDFTTLLLTINPELIPGEYPQEWTSFTLTVRERSREPVTGRFAFRYWVTDSGPDGTNGDYIGIDTVSVTQEVPPPGGGCDNPVDIPWLSIDPTSGTTPPVDTVPADVNVAAGDLEIGTYTAQLCVNTNDPNAPQISVPVTLEVVQDDGVPEILLVDDDDNGPDARAFFTDTLDGLGQAYNIWDTANSDNEPTPADLEPYDAVIWFTGDEFGGFAGPGPDGEAALGTWLDDGGCLFISSQDYLFDRGTTPFMQNYLGMAEGQSDVGQTEVTGAGSVFGGLGPYSLVYPFTNFSDVLTPDGTAEVAFSGDQGDAALDKDSGTYRTTFWGFPFAALPDTAALEEAMFTVLDWCGVAADTGFIAGTVTDLTNGGTPIEGASVTAGSRTTETDVDGNYSMRVPVGTYDVTASKDNYVPVTVPGVEVVLDETTTVDFELEGSTLAYDPDAIEQSMESGDVVSTTVTLTATGPLPVDFEVSIGGFEGPSASPPVKVAVVDGGAGSSPRAAVGQSTPTATRTSSRVSPEVARFIRDRGRNGGTSGAAMDLASVLGEPLPSVPVKATLGGVDCDAEPGIIIHDDGTIENGYSGNPSLVSEVRFVDKFTPDSYPATFSNVCVAFVTLAETALNFDIVVYDDDGTDGAPGTELGSLAVAAEGIPTFPNPTPVWFSYDISSLGLQIPDGDVYIGVRYAPPSAPNVFTAADESTGNPPGFAGGYWWNNNDGVWTPTQTTFPAYRSMMIRAVGGTAGTIWASAEPESGTVQPGEPFTVEVTFDATELVQEGTYTANMEFSGTFVNDVAPMPLTMHLTCPTCGTLAGAITDSTTGNPLSATVTVVGDGGFNTSSEGETYSLTAPADTYSITAEADGYLPQTVEGVVLAAGETVTTDFALVPAVAILEYTPESIEADMEPGDVVTTPVTVTNPGTIPLEFSVAFVDFEGPAVSQPVVSVVERSSRPVRADVGEGGTPSWTDPTLAVVEPGLFASNDFESLGSLTFYEDRGEFDTVHPDLPLEDFSDTNVPDGQVVTCLPPFNSETDNACFSPGDILPGLSMDVTPNGGPGDAVVLTPPFAGVPCVSVGPNTFVDFADWDFNPPVPAVGFDMQSNVGGASFTLTIFGPDGELGSTDVTVGGLGAPSFFGVDTSDSGGISRIEVRDTAGAGELFCNVAFGGSLGPVWAHAEPESGTVPPGESVTFDVIFDASELIQEGTYTANMRFSGNFSNDPADMPLTLNLTCPTCGTLAGSITDATTGEPLEATVTVTGAGGFTTEVTGTTYSITAPADTYTITAEAEGYFSQTVEGVVLGAGETVTTDFALVAMIAILEYSPASIEETLPLGGTASNTVTVSNTGTIPLDFSVNILNFEGPTAAQPVRVSVVDRRPSPGAVRAGEGGTQTAMDLASILGGPLPSLPVKATLGGGVDCDAEPGIIIHDDGTIENGYSGNPSLVNEVRFVDKFTPAGYPATFSSVCVAFVTLNENTLSFDIVVYDDDGPNGEPGTELGSLAVTAEGIPTFPNPAPVWFSYDISSMELSIPDGDVYIGVRYAPPSAPNVFTAADESTGNPPGFAGGYWWNNNDGIWTPIQNTFVNYRSMMVRAVGGIAGPVWASAVPDSGTVGPGEQVTFEVIFDASLVEEIGTYTADLRFSGTFSNEPPDMPLTMNVTE